MSKIKKINLPTSVDKFLDGKIIIEQLLDGGRSNTDTILLSAAVPVGPCYKVLDVGVDDISKRRPQIICNHFDHVCKDVIRTR